MVVHQIKVGKMAVFCYLIGDEDSRTCAVVDPAFETDKVLMKAEKEGYQITHVINTHGHSDHTSGNADIIHHTRAALLIHKSDSGRLTKVLHKAFSRILGGKGSPQADRLLEHGEVVEIGSTALTVIHTPGHTPGSICLYSPGHIFTGDTLFVGGTGRTDLPGGSHHQLVCSIRKNIYSLPGDTIIWPGHDYGSSPTSTILYEQRTNPYT